MALPSEQKEQVVYDGEGRGDGGSSVVLHYHVQSLIFPVCQRLLIHLLIDRTRTKLHNHEHCNVFRDNLYIYNLTLPKTSCFMSRLPRPNKLRLSPDNRNED